jgi:hypothetical protein
VAIEPYSLNLINRTLVYGILTATLALSRILTRQEQQPRLAIVVSTLVIAALFNPDLSRRLHPPTVLRYSSTRVEKRSDKSLSSDSFP